MSIIAELLCGDDFIGGKMVWLQDDRKPFFFIDIFLFHVHLTVSFFSKLVIPVHVSMEEPVFLKKRKWKSTSVNVLVDGKETTAHKKILQVPTSIAFLIIHLWLVRKPSDLHHIAFRCSVRNVMH